MVDPRQRFHFLQELLAKVRVLVGFLAQNFDHHSPRKQLPVLRQINDAHPAAPQFLLNLVTIHQHGARAQRGVRGRGTPNGRMLQARSAGLIGLQQAFHLTPQPIVAVTMRAHKAQPGVRLMVQGPVEESFDLLPAVRGHVRVAGGIIAFPQPPALMLGGPCRSYQIT